MDKAGLERAVDFGATGGVVGGDKGKEDEQEFAPSEGVVVIEEDADAHMQQNAHDHTHDETLQHLVFGLQAGDAAGITREREGKGGPYPSGTPEAVVMTNEKSHQHQSYGDVVQHDAVKEPLVDVAVGVYHGHALEEGMDAEADE